MATPPSAALDGNRIVKRILLLTQAYVTAAVGVIVLYLVGLLRLPAEQWRGFFEIVGVTLVAIVPAMVLAHRRVFLRIRDAVDALASGGASPETLRRGFAAVVDFPRYWFVWGAGWWALGGSAVSIAMKLRYPAFPPFDALVLVAGAVSASFVTDLYYFFSMKRFLAPVRKALAEAIDDVAERAAHTRRVSLRTKLLVATTSVLLVTTVFSALLAHVRSSRALEESAAARVDAALAAIASEVADDPGALAREGAIFARLGVARRLVRLSPEGGAASDDPLLSEDLLARIGASPAARGFEAAPGGTALVAWRRLPHGGALIAVAEAASAAVGIQLGALAGLLVFSTLVGVGVAVLLADDVARSTSALAAEAARVASGDLTRGAVLDSEDELGELGHAFERMAASLRSTVSRVAAAADRVDASSGAISDAALTVTSVTADQMRGLQQAAFSMERIDEQVRGIAESAGSLNESVDGLSGSVIELDAVGEQLSERSASLLELVNEVSASVGQMMSTVESVERSADALAGAADDTTSSMEQTAAAVREVDRNAAETGRLAERMTEVADTGMRRVRDTVRGMEAIREATETASAIIERLAGGTREVEAVVHVIDGVADETSLLALNAAIIAAQAGEQGRAFAVVATEIRALAERVLASTKEIDDLIRGFQRSGTDSIAAIRRGGEAVRAGVGLSSEASDALEEIERSARSSGERVEEIVAAVREQAQSVAYVARLMEGVRGGVEEIRRSLAEHGLGAERLHGFAATVEEVARAVRATTLEQAASAREVRTGMDRIREAVFRIHEALQEQTAACQQGAQLMERVTARTRSNEETVRSMDEATRGLRREAESLRSEVGRFRI